jgi:putative endonuclease
MNITTKKEKGNFAETYVANYLEKQNFQILSRNFTIKGGEIDIIAQKKDLIIFVEVRSWSRIFWQEGTPLQTISKAKMKRIIKTAKYFILKNNINIDNFFIRFDVAGIIGKKDEQTLEYFEGAFDSEAWF